MDLRARAVRQVAAVVVSLAAILMLPLPVAAHQPGDLDRSFAGDGFTRVDFGGYPQAMEIFPSGQGGFTVVGTWHSSQYQSNLRPRLALARLNADGSPDTSFGEDGRVIVDPGFRGYDAPAGWDQAPNGDLIVAGVLGADDGYYLIKFAPNGRRVRSFAERGMLIWRSSKEWHPVDVRWLPDGRILVLGWTETTGLIRAHNPDGSIDRTFGDNGSVEFFGNASELAVQPHGRLIVTGWSKRRFIARAFHPDGSVDRSFGNRGRAASEPLESSWNLWNADALVTSSGEIVGVGTFVFTEHEPLFVIRFTADGKLDGSLGNGTGRVDLAVPNHSLPYAATELPGGGLAVTGNYPKTPHDDDSRDPRKVFVAAANHDGTMWQEFATDGYFASYFGRRRETNTGTAAAVINGELVIAGTADDYQSETGKWLIANFHLD